MPTLFVSDLHLDPACPAAVRFFCELLEQRGPSYDALYILGDLFEIWVGDDAIDPAFGVLVEALSACAGAGTPVYLLHGNRDFLIGAQFLSSSDCTLLPDRSLIDLYGDTALLMHGDALCTDDTDYQRFRTQVRNPGWQQAFLAKPVEQRLCLASQARAASDQANRLKPQAVMDVNQQAVEQALRESGARLLIHGHTHRPGIHRFELDGQAVRRAVLGDWYRHASLLIAKPGTLKLETLRW